MATVKKAIAFWENGRSPSLNPETPETGFLFSVTHLTLRFTTETRFLGLGVWGDRIFGKNRSDRIFGKTEAIASQVKKRRSHRTIENYSSELSGLRNDVSFITWNILLLLDMITNGSKLL
ncbi:MAG: hypothetical protein ACRC8Y_20230 [Chroococcales cyanobacterium]